MGIFKRLVLLIYGLCATAAFAALGIMWYAVYGPWSYSINLLMDTDWFYRAVATVSLLGVFGSLFIFLSWIFALRKHAIEVSLPDGSRVSVTQDAIRSRVVSIVEADGSCIADNVLIRAKKRRGKLGIFVRVCPMNSLDVIEKGAALKSELRRGLSSLCGNRPVNIRLEFTEPQTEEYRMGWEESAASYVDDIATDDFFVKAASDNSSTNYEPVDTIDSELNAEPDSEFDAKPGAVPNAEQDTSMQATEESE